MNKKFIPISSELVVKSSGSLNIEQDLNTQENKTIAELLYDKEEQTPQQCE